MKEKLGVIFSDLCREFGWRAVAIGPLIGTVIYQSMKAEARRLARGWTYEPPTFYEVNRAAWRLARRNGQRDHPTRRLATSVSPVLAQVGGTFDRCSPAIDALLPVEDAPAPLA